jgi:cellulose synthase/poly-beta-1,6-N-acetylglucosamine synthase-like glycosyltransferase
MPCRDARETLEEALDSVLSQREVALEVLVVDDGSSDGSAELAARVAAQHRAVRVLRSPGRGLVAALNHGLGECSAALIARMDADDVCLPGRLATQRDALARDATLQVLGTRVEAFPEAAVAGGLARYLAWQNGLLSAEAHAAQLFVEAPLCHPSVMLRREALLGLGGYRGGPFAEDYDLWLRLDAAGARMAKLPEVLLRWRQHPARTTLRDPRYALARFPELKAPFLAQRLARQPRPIDLWGAGPTGKRLARQLEKHGVRVGRFIDIDPRKIGRTARAAPIVAPEALAGPGERWVVVAVGAAGARDLVRAHLDARGFREGQDYLCAS